MIHMIVIQEYLLKDKMMKYMHGQKNIICTMGLMNLKKLVNYSLLKKYTVNLLIALEIIKVFCV